MTVADSVYDEVGGRSDADFAADYAALLNWEARALSDAGADIIQIDEPCFNIYIDEVKDWGVEMLEKSLEGVSAKTAVHICYGYGTEVVLKWKNSNTDWSHYDATLPLIAESSIDVISMEAAASGVDLAVLDHLEGKDVMVGVIDVGTEEVESPQVVADRIRDAMEHVTPDRLIAGTDCGMVPRSRRAAEGKMNADLAEVDGRLLVVSQFTLHAKTKKGTRPSFIRAAKPDHAVPLYEHFVQACERETGTSVATGEFGAAMEVDLVNDGPVTMVLDSNDRKG